MNPFSISLSDYGSGAGEMSASDLEHLKKALSAGQITGRETEGLSTASGAPLKVESLENTLKILTFKEQDIQMWKAIPKLPAYNTVEEYNELTEYGTEDSGFNLEGELPEEDDSIYTRRSQLVKFMGETRKVTHPMQLVTTMIGNALEQEAKNGTMSLLRKANRALAFADSSIVPQEFNGLFAQHKNHFGNSTKWIKSDYVIDLKGKQLNEGAIESACLAIIQGHGAPDKLMAPPTVLSDLASQFHESKLIQPGIGNIDSKIGQRNKTFISQFGDIELGYDKFLAQVPKSQDWAPKSTEGKPAAPASFTVTNVATPTDTVFTFAASEVGDYIYGVTAVNRKGESPMKMGDATVTTTEGSVVSLAITPSVSATGYKIYRSKKNDVGAEAKLYPIYSISAEELTNGHDGGSANVSYDRNKFIAGTEKAFLLQADVEVYSFKQLAPLMKMDLARLDPSTRFMLLLYGTPILYAPKKFVTFINIGKES